MISRTRVRFETSSVEGDQAEQLAHMLNQSRRRLAIMGGGAIAMVGGGISALAGLLGAGPGYVFGGFLVSIWSGLAIFYQGAMWMKDLLNSGSNPRE